MEFWAKTDESGRPGISVRDHCINVGCVAEALSAVAPEAVRALLPQGAATLVALHDIGKISPGFLRKCDSWRGTFETADFAAQWGQREQNHAAVSHAIVGHWLGKAHAGYAIAVGGHHGFFCDDTHQPPLGQGGRWLGPELKDPDFLQGRDETRHALVQIFGDLPEIPLSRKDEALIVFLTGYMTFADWLGSNETFFPLSDAADITSSTVTEAAELGRSRAQEVVEWLRWGRTEVRMPLGFGDLFPGFSPNSMQQALTEVAAKPGLYIVEAPMGGGKTEAALAATYHRWAGADGQQGLYFALPTQLTSERIFERLEGFLSNALETPDLATLVHGSSWLREKRVLEIRPALQDGDNMGDSENPRVYAHDARQWFASSRQALLAPFGAGTIDQALLGVLPAKHCGLRLFGLAGKVVVLDEVHSYDHYTGTLVDKLVTDLLRLNATVIVLSATLTAERKRALLRSAGVAGDSLPAMEPDDPYPMITFTASEANGTARAGTRRVPWEEPAKTIVLDHRRENDPSVWEEACEAAEHGACVLIIRNTVALAQQTWRMLRNATREGGPEMALLHSRFPRWRRDALEDRWVAALGKRGPRPKGCLLIATQVVEQSVDIDADLLITELAPTDLLFQRLGRLHRHCPERPEAFRKPKAILLHPDLGGCKEEKSLKQAFGASGFVYPPYVLWRSSKQWDGRPSVTLPQDIRPWLEATYASVELEDSVIHGLMAEWTRKSEKLSNTAGRRTSRLTASNQKDEEGTFTRWNDQPTGQILLAQAAPVRIPGTHSWEILLLDNQRITIPFGEWSLSAAKAIHRNLVRVPRYAIRSWYAGNPQWLGDYVEDGVFGVVTGGDISALEPLDSPYILTWHEDEGVRIQKKAVPAKTEAPPDEPEDGWW